MSFFYLECGRTKPSRIETQRQRRKKVKKKDTGQRKVSNIKRSTAEK
jgi:hypothetical protein